MSVNAPEPNNANHDCGAALAAPAVQLAGYRNPVAPT
jgi:hypothetical protein